MSLLITSNYQDEYASVLKDDKGQKINQGTPIQNPASYSNHLTNPLRIPPNSEVAVQSVCFNRKKVFNVADGDLWYFYNGKALRTAGGGLAEGTGIWKTNFGNYLTENATHLNMEHSVNIPIPIEMRPGEYNTAEFQVELARAVNECFTNPMWWKRCRVETYSTGGTWDGWKFKFGSRALQTADTQAKNLITWRGFDENTPKETGGSSWTQTIDGNTMVLKRNVETADHDSINCSIINMDVPMNLANGAVEIDLFDDHDDSGDSYAGFGFTRPKLYEQNMPFFKDNENSGNAGIGMPFHDAYNDRVGYCDYRVDWNEHLDGSGAELILSHVVWDAEKSCTIQKEIEYWKAFPGGDNGSSNPVKNKITKANLASGGGSGYKGIFKVNFIGNGIKLWMQYFTSDGMGGGANSWKLVCDSTTSANRKHLAYTWAPITQNKEALYLLVSMKHKNHDVVINKLVADSTIFKGETDEFKFGDEDTCGDSWWSKCRWEQPGGSKTDWKLPLALNVEKRKHQRADADARDGTEPWWEGVDASSQVPAKTKVLVVSEPIDDTTTQWTPGQYFPCQNANMGAQLGFPNRSYVESCATSVGTTYKQNETDAQADPSAAWHLNSAVKPMSLSHSAFVRCPSLSVESYNFCKSIPSQILYHLPRGGGGGKAGVGEVEDGNGSEIFCEPAEKTYIKLRNKDWINLTQIQIDICDKNEHLCTDLTGNTTCVLHIKHQDESVGATR